MRTPEEIIKQIKSEGLHHPIDRPNWDSIWLGHAKIASLRSHDARTQCGCVLVKDNLVIAEGTNGYIRGISDDLLPNKEYHQDYVLTKRMIHSECNALFNAARNGNSTLGAIAYITGLPCTECYQALWQAGISEVVVPEDSKVPNCMQNSDYTEYFSLLSFLTENRMPVRKASCIISVDKKAVGVQS